MNVLLIDGEEKLGVMPTEQALKIAQEKELDLVEVAPMANPPVCRVMNYGTYLYNLKKKLKGQTKAKRTETKTIRLSIRTDKHDLEVKAAQARKFLEGRNLIKAVVIFKGREITHHDLGAKKLNQFYGMLEDICVKEQEPKKQGYQMVMMLNPK